MASSIHHTSQPSGGEPHGAGEPAYSPEEISGELGRILTSQTFHSADGQRRFLRFVVEQAVAGLSHEVKEYSIGVEVFDRGKSFDPRLDNIVRAEARKLRIRLAKYYAGEGELNPLRIELPSRGYVPVFRASSNTTIDVPDQAMVIEEDIVPAVSPASADTPSAIPDAPPTDVRSQSLLTGLLQLLDWKSAAAIALGLLAVAAALAFGLRFIGAGSAGGPPLHNPSIAVLPFNNFGDKTDESFSDGLAEELIDALGRVKGLQVVGSASAFQFRNKRPDIREIGNKLNVNTILEGSVRAYGDRLRITVELADTKTGFRLWSNSYDREFKDALFIQRDIAQSIVSALSSGFAKSGTRNTLEFQPSKAVPVNVQAYQDYLKGLYFWNKQTSESVKTAVGYFEQAIKEDPTYALSYAGLARCYVNMPALSAIPSQSVVPRIQQLAAKVLELDSSLAEPHIDLAYASFLRYDWDGAADEFKRGLEISPGDAVAHRWYASYLSNVGPLQNAMAEAETALQLDPVSTYMLWGVGQANYLMGRYDESIDHFKRVVAMDNQYGYGHLGLGLAYSQKHQYAEAINQLKTARQLMGETSSATGELAYAYAVSGNQTQARELLDFLLKQSKQVSVPAKAMAHAYVGLGLDDLAFQWLGKAIDERDGYLYLKFNPMYNRLRNDPRFTELLIRANLTKH